MSDGKRVPEMKINTAIDIAEKITELKNIAIESIQMKHREWNNKTKKSGNLWHQEKEIVEYQIVKMF